MSSTNGHANPPGSYRDHPDAPIDEAEETARLEELQEGHPTPLPRFLQDAHDRLTSSSSHKYLPSSLRNLAHWAKGPAQPITYRINPLFPTIQHLPLLLLDRYLPKRKHRISLFFAYLLLWLATFSLVKRQESSITELKPWGKPQEIGCGNAFWARGNLCDLHGSRCRPFQSAEFAFRCPANCAAYHLSEPRAVGDQLVNYQPLVIGGGDDNDGAYRGDSFICAAAIHAGAVSNAEGGCGVVKLDGARDGYASSVRNGIESVGFDSYFPMSYVFEQSVQCKARDMRWPLLAVSVVFTTILSLFTASPALFFFTVFSGIFWHVGLVSDPPTHTSFRELFTIIVGKYVPVMFTAWVMYDKMAVRRTLRGLTAQVEKTLLWLGACWVGALDNYTLSPHIPINRLNAHDINQQPGGVAALVLIVLAIAAIALQQIWCFRQEARLLRYGALYLGLVAAILALLLLALCDLHLRLHHYILALLLLTGTSVQTRPALLYQGLLVGLFINGIARWGWDPVLQTSYALRGEGRLGSVLPRLVDGEAPVVRVGSEVANITFRWEAPPERNVRLDGISLLVNDVERFRGYFEDDETFDATRSFVWTRPVEREVKEYFRFAYISGTRSLDYTKAGVWAADLEWVPMQPGASSVQVEAQDLDSDVNMVD